MSRRYSVSETTLRSATRCNRPPAPGLEALWNIGLALAQAQVLRLALTGVLVLTGEIGELEEIPG
jgi:hypothetical protein